MSKAYCSTSSPGEITVTLTVPSIDENTNKLLYNESSAAPTAMEDVVNGEAGTWTAIGKGLNLQDEKALAGMAMIISENKKYAIVIKNLDGRASIAWDNASTTPLGYKLTFSLEGIAPEGDTDGDVVFVKWVKTV